MGLEDITVDGKSLDQWENEYSQGMEAPEITDEDTIKMGIVRPQEREAEGNQFYQTLDTLGVEHPDEGKEYEKLGVGDTLKDIGKTMGAEALRVFAPKAGSKTADFLHYSEDDLYKHESQTRIGEASKYLYRYIAGTAAFLAGGEAVGGVAIAAGAINKSEKLVKLGVGIQKVLGTAPLLKNGANAGKLKRVGTWLANKAIEGSVAGALADYNLYSKEEGHMADVFGVTDNPLISYLQTNENDSDAQARFKNVVEGFLMGCPIGIGIGGLGAARSYFKSLKNVATATSKEATTEALKEFTMASENMNKVLETGELIQTVKDMRVHVSQNGGDVEQLIMNHLPESQWDTAKKMNGVFDSGEDIFQHSDGTWDIKVNSWEDAHKVSKDEYRKQLSAFDEINEMERYGDTAINHSDEATRSTWINRGWIGENEALTPTNANKIVKNYKDKFQIDNNIKVEFVDGLTIKGEKVDGNTSSTSYLGKTAKSTQNKIDKKALQVQKLQDKVTMLEGGNEPVMDALDAAKEELRIAENELDELQKTAKGQNLKPNITIQIDKNAKNPFATLRAEIEHARDIAKGEVPNQKKQHFSRYEGMNEAEAAVDYTYKKSVGRNNVLNTPESKFDSWYNDKQAESTIGDLINNEAFQSEGILDDVLNVKVRHSSDKLPTDTPFNDADKYTLGGYTTIENDEVIIYTNSNLSKEAVEENLYHELQHARDLETAYFNPEATATERSEAAQAIQEVMSAVKAGDTSAYKNSKWEVKADLNKEFLKNKKKEYYDRQSNTLKGGGNNNNEVRLSHEGDETTINGTGNGQGNSLQQGLGDTSTNLQETVGEPKQLTLDFKSSEDAVQQITEGNVPNTIEGIDKAITKAADKEIPVTGKNWQALFEDTDAIPLEIKEILDMDSDDLAELFNTATDAKSLAQATRKEMFSVKVISGLKDKMDALGKDAPIESKRQIIDALEYLKEYKKSIGSEFGRGLNEQKPINEVLEQFGNKRFSKVNREGIVSFMELLKNITDELNFTRGDFVNNKQALLARLSEENPALLSTFQQAGKQYQKALDDILSEVAKEGQNADLKALGQRLEDVFTNSEYEAVFDALNLAKDKKSWWRTFRNWTNQYGSLESYYVHNLLSSPASVERNVFSGLVNTFYFPALKIAGGVMTKNPELRQRMINEGMRTYGNLIVSMKESWDLACQAWLKGDGKLSSFTSDTMNEASDTFRGFHDMTEDNNFFQWVQNIHSSMTRAMGASDEFMKQLNYRAIARSKAMEQVDEMAIQAGKVGDKDWYKERFEQVFDSYFEKNTGKPTDPEIFSEAAEILYQNPLSGAYKLNEGLSYDIRTGNMLEAGQEATQTVAMKIGQSLQDAANHNLMAKIFFPFVKTGTNILQENLDHNLVYAFLSKEQRVLLQSNTPQGIMARGKLAFGTFSFTMASMMALSGLVTGSLPANKKERDALLATGWRPYSFKVGNQYVSYQGYEPLHTILGFAADSMNLITAIATKEDEEAFGKYFVQCGSILFNNFLDKAAFRQGFQSMSSLMELNEENLPNIQRTIASPIGGFLFDSAGVKYLSTLGSRDAKSPQGITEQIFNQYFNRGLGEYRRNAFGEKQTITNAALATSSTQPNSMPEDMELNRLAELGYKPSQISEVKSGYNINFRDFKDENGRNAYDYMMEDLSESGLREAVRDLVTSDYYNSLSADGVVTMKEKLMGVKYTSSDETKVNALNDVFIEYNDEVKNNLTTKHPNLVNDRGETLEEAMERADMAKQSQILGEQFNGFYGE